MTLRIWKETADYLVAAVAALEAGQENIRPYMTQACTECGQAFTTSITGWPEGHLIWGSFPPDAKSMVPVLLVGCEGYAFINPRLLGLDRPEWQDWTITTEEGRLADLERIAVEAPDFLDENDVLDLAELQAKLGKAS